MASSSGNSSGSTQLQNSGSEEDMQAMMDQKKRKRMQSNRESARRSRMRRQKHLDGLIAQATELRKENSETLTNINATTQLYLNVEAENAILRAQMMELSQRLDSLNEILNYINNTTRSSNGIFENDDDDDLDLLHTSADCFMNPFNSVYLNQPIMASPDLFQY